MFAAIPRSTECAVEPFLGARLQNFAKVAALDCAHRSSLKPMRLEVLDAASTEHYFGLETSAMVAPFSLMERASAAWAPYVLL